MEKSGSGRPSERLLRSKDRSPENHPREGGHGVVPGDRPVDHPIGLVEKKVRDLLNHEQRKGLIDPDCPEFSLSLQAALLGVSRSGLYYKPVSPSKEEVALRHRIDEVYTRWPFYGSRRIAAVLKREGLPVGRARIQTAMREMGIEGIHPGPNLSKRALEHKIYPYLLRNVTAQYPHHIWGIDITYIRLVQGWMYLVAIIDWHSRFVLSRELDQTLEIRLSWTRWIGPFRPLLRPFSIVTMDLTSPATAISSVSFPGTSRSAWMGKAEPRTIFSRNGSGEA